VTWPTTTRNSCLSANNVTTWGTVLLSSGGIGEKFTYVLDAPEALRQCYTSACTFPSCKLNCSVSPIQFTLGFFLTGPDALAWYSFLKYQPAEVQPGLIIATTTLTLMTTLITSLNISPMDRGTNSPELLDTMIVSFLYLAKSRRERVHAAEKDMGWNPCWMFGHECVSNFCSPYRWSCHFVLIAWSSFAFHHFSLDVIIADNACGIKMNVQLAGALTTVD
jgi:hypothetical protein